MFGLCCVLAAQQASAPAAREVRDPATGMRWVLVRDPEHPGGPGKLIPVADAGKNASGLAHKPAVIRAGDRIVVEEHSAVVDASFEATALDAAEQGARLRVRIRVLGGPGGPIAWARAVERGRAELETGQEAGDRMDGR